MNTLGLPMITIEWRRATHSAAALKSLLSFNVIIAERTAKFGFPETLFGLFPGMGAYSLGGATGRRGIRRGDDAQRKHLHR